MKLLKIKEKEKTFNSIKTMNLNKPALQKSKKETNKQKTLNFWIIKKLITKKLLIKSRKKKKKLINKFNNNNNNNKFNK